MTTPRQIIDTLRSEAALLDSLKHAYHSRFKDHSHDHTASDNRHPA